MRDWGWAEEYVLAMWLMLEQAERLAFRKPAQSHLAPVFPEKTARFLKKTGRAVEQQREIIVIDQIFG